MSQPQLQLRIPNSQLPDTYNFYLDNSDSLNKPAARITKDGVFQVYVDPTDENARKFVELVNNALQGKAAPLTAMEVINGEQDR